MKARASILAILLVACGGGGGNDEDTSTDTPGDALDTQGDTSTDEAIEGESPECTLDDDCDNGIYCDGEETCSAGGTCQDGTPTVCDDSNPCTTDTCNEGDDECTFDPTDSDGDGHATAVGPGGETCPGTDCDDTDASIYLGALPVECSDVDNDCNGSTDGDNDGDGHVDIACTGGEDCNDGEAGVWDGAWYDATTGYLWEDPPSSVLRTLNDAGSYCDGLTLCGSAAGDWHVPTISELRTLIRGCPVVEDGGACGVTDSCLSYGSCHSSSCFGCVVLEGPDGGCYWDPALEGNCSWYWSSSSLAEDTSENWCVYFDGGDVTTDHMDYLDYVRCVRTGP